MRILPWLEFRDQTRMPQDPHVVQLSTRPRFHGVLPAEKAQPVYNLYLAILASRSTYVEFAAATDRVPHPCPPPCPLCADRRCFMRAVLLNAAKPLPIPRSFLKHSTEE